MDDKQAREKMQSLLASAIDLTDNQTDYVNAVGLMVNQIEAVVCLYLIQPAIDDTLQAQQLYKFIMPIAVAENFAQMLMKDLADREAKSVATDEGESDE